ncbi:MAG: sigma-70 family RNA polymerase sigma factor [Spirochaetaceae bacterium]|nr:sigma-70 family RNA polymerase sigma factor [Myxococcales bacterium]MCB9724255.1 sigma-70 family RNA polymerase sigma factor [Spirochaetaceae bacterium]HPG26839.1 sigma-70 family RNA polymerase sigma factor [Myxococcota bacterium]
MIRAARPVCDEDHDLALVLACQRGGADAEPSFAALVDRHSARVRRRAARILGDEAEAEDVVQEVFSNVHRFLDRYTPDRPFGHWLSVVTLNACRIALRKRSGRERRHGAFATDPGHPTEARLDTDPMLRDWLRVALAELPPTTRDCILLRVLDGLSHREIAERLGSTEPAIKMRVRRGLRELRARHEEAVAEAAASRR